jgi:hypothetical protein
MKILLIKNEFDCPHYSEEDDLGDGVMLKCGLGLETRWERGSISYKIPKECPLKDAPKKKPCPTCSSWAGMKRAIYCMECGRKIK